MKKQKNFPKCPRCDSDKVVPIKYGYPGIELMEKQRKEKIKLGGCVISPDNWYCKNCELDFE